MSVLEITDDVLTRIDQRGEDLNCYITVLAEEARKQARVLDRLLQKGRYLGPLHGLSVAIKDNTATAGVRTTAGSAVLQDWIPEFDATVVDRLKRAGAIVVGKANLYEFAAGGVHPLYGATRNPWNLERSAGASSSGSAAAVAAGLAHLGTGSDTGGSIRVPASVCGIVGLKPSFGLVSRYGVIPGSYDLDAVGLLGPDVWGVAAALTAVAGADDADPATKGIAAANYLTELERGIAGIRIGLPTSLREEPIDAEFLQAFDRAAELIVGCGARTTEVRIPSLVEARTVMLVIHAVEAAEYHHRHMRESKGPLSDGVRRLLQLGELVSATEYVRCQRIRRKQLGEMRTTFEEIDVLLLPTLPIAAWPANATAIEIDGQLEDLIPAITRYTPIFNLTGQPAISVPCGPSAEGLPFGLQLAGRPREDHVLLRVAHAYEGAAGGFELPVNHQALASTGGTP